jgi:DNA-binding NtrC family response regulator
VVTQSPFTNPILLVDPDVDLGRGLLQQLTRHGFCADLAITVETARACVGVRYYRAMVVVADLSDCQHLFGLRQLREVSPQTWIIVATGSAFLFRFDLSVIGDVSWPLSVVGDVFQRRHFAR